MSREADPPRRPRRPEPDSYQPEPEPEPSTWTPAPRPAARPAARRENPYAAPTTPAGESSWLERLMYGKVSPAILSTFCRQFASYLDAGVDVKKAIGNLQDQFARTALGPPLGRLGQSLRRGDGFAESFAREPSTFDPLFLAMMRAAEARGGVPEILRRLSTQYEARRRLMRQAKTALIFPLAVLAIAGGVVVLLVYFVLPVLVNILEDMTRKGGGTESLPGPTRLLVGMTHFATSIGWWAVPLGVVAALFGLKFAYKTPAGRSAIDEACLHIPVLGPLLRKIDTARLARTLGSLLEGGVDVGHSLALTTDVMRMAPYQRALRGARTLVKEGSELAEALDASGRFGTDVISTIETGEESGQLPETLEHLAEDYEEQVSHMVKNLGSLIQPFLTIALGGFVAFIVIAFMMAYVSVISGLAGG